MDGLPVGRLLGRHEIKDEAEAASSGGSCMIVLATDAPPGRILAVVEPSNDAMSLPVVEGKWLTVVSPEGPDGIELLLEPNGHPAVRTLQGAMFRAGIPLTAFAVDDIQKEYERQKKLGVVLNTEPTSMGKAMVAVFDDNCGNHIQLYQA